MEHASQEDVDKLVADYKAHGKAYMLCEFRKIVDSRKLRYYEMLVVMDKVWLTISPGTTRAARIKRNKLIRGA